MIQFLAGAIFGGVLVYALIGFIELDGSDDDFYQDDLHMQEDDGEDKDDS